MKAAFLNEESVSYVPASGENVLSRMYENKMIIQE